MYLCEIDYGSVPDWIQAIGAISAAVGLIVTLKLQRKTLQEQQFLTQLERKRFLDSYLPILECIELSKFKKDQYIETKFDIVVRENFLRNLSITHNFDDNWEIDIPYYVQDVILPKDYRFKFKVSTTLDPVFADVTEYTGNTIIFKFEDALGNAYTQHVIYKDNELEGLDRRKLINPLRIVKHSQIP